MRLQTGARGNDAAMTVLGDAPPVHEHLPHLIEVDFDDTGHSAREMGCTTCGTVWFE